MSFVQPFSLAKLTTLSQSFSEMCPFCVAVLSQLPSLFSDGFIFVFPRRPKFPFGVQESSRLLMIGVFLLQDDFCFVDHLLQLSKGCRPSQYWSPCPLHVDTLIFVGSLSSSFATNLSIL